MEGLGDAGGGEEADGNSVGDTALLCRRHCLAEHLPGSQPWGMGKGMGFGDGAGRGKQPTEMSRCPYPSLKGRGGSIRVGEREVVG